MRLLSLPFTIVKSAATAVTDTAGAVGGAVINGATGGVRGAASGVAHGLHTGSRSSTTAALALVAVGATGVVDWPLIVFVGGTGLLLRELTNRPPAPPAIATPTVAASSPAATTAIAPTPKAVPTAKAVKAKSTTSPAKPRPRR